MNTDNKPCSQMNDKVPCTSCGESINLRKVSDGWARSGDAWFPPGTPILCSRCLQKGRLGKEEEEYRTICAFCGEACMFSGFIRDDNKSVCGGCLQHDDHDRFDPSCKRCWVERNEAKKSAQEIAEFVD